MRHKSFQLYNKTTPPCSAGSLQPGARSPAFATTSLPGVSSWHPLRLGGSILSIFGFGFRAQVSLCTLVMVIALMLTTSDFAVGAVEEAASQPAPVAKPLRLGIVGLVHGHVYGFLQDALRRSDVQLVGMAEPRDELLRRYGKHHHTLPDAILFRDVDTMLDTARPEAVAVFTDTLGHADVVEACARRGIHVMMEKPLAVSMEHARRIERAARTSSIHVIINYETTWYPNTQAAFTVVKRDKRIGGIRKIVVLDGHQGPKEIGVSHEFLEWLTDPARNGSGALHDFGCYGADLATWLMDGRRPTQVVAVTQQLKSDPVYKQVDDEATILLTYPDAQVIIQASWNWPYSRKDIEIYSETGVYSSVGSQAYRLGRGPGNDDLKQAPPPKPPMTDSISYLRAVARGEIKPKGLSSLAVNMIVTEILDAARRSAETGQAVTLDKQ